MIRLYQRERELEQVHDFYRTSQSRQTTSRCKTTPLLWIQGAEKGVGATSLAESLRPVVQADNGYFIKCQGGKAPVLTDQEVYFPALDEALNSLLEQMKGRGEGEMKRIRAALSHENDELQTPSFRSLIKAIPQLASFFREEENGKPHSPTSDPNECIKNEGKRTGGHLRETNKTTLTFDKEILYCKFLSMVCNWEYPLVLLVDDIQFVDDRSIDLLLDIMMNQAIQGLSIAATYEEGPMSKPRVTRLLDQIECNQIEFFKVPVLSRFEQTGPIQCMLESRLGSCAFVSDDTINKIVYDIFDKTNGNPFWVDQYVSLVSARWNGQQECDEQVPPNLIVPVADFVSTRMQNLPLHLQRDLQRASCLSPRLDNNVLQHVVTKPNENDMLLLKQSGLCTATTKSTDLANAFSFPHACVKAAIYMAMKEEEKSLMHYQIGIDLWKGFQLKELDQHLIPVVIQLRLGAVHIVKKKERTAIVKLCLRAGERSVLHSSFQMAYHILRLGFGLLDHSADWKTDYELCLSTYSALAEVAYCSGHYEEVDALAKAVSYHAKTLSDSLWVKTTQVFVMGSQSQPGKAFDFGMKILEKTGVQLPKKSSKLTGFLAMLKLRRALKGLSQESILRLPLLTHSNTTGALRILNSCIIFAFVDRETMVPYMVERIVQLTLRDGLSGMSAIGFALAGILSIT